MFLVFSGTHHTRHSVIKGPPVVKSALRSACKTDQMLYGSAEAEKNVERILEVLSSKMSTITLVVPGRRFVSKKSRFDPGIESSTCYSLHARVKPIRRYGQRNLSTIQVLSTH